ncbi:MAG: hypothetical protein K2H16_07625, partial [Prevotella sp.]|nr:hypothetical protein [Prevotella sp.]
FLINILRRILLLIIITFGVVLLIILMMIIVPVSYLITGKDYFTGYCLGKADCIVSYLNPDKQAED